MVFLAVVVIYIILYLFHTHSRMYSRSSKYSFKNGSFEITCREELASKNLASYSQVCNEGIETQSSKYVGRRVLLTIHTKFLLSLRLEKFRANYSPP